jgi:cysteine desulfurase
MSVPIYLDHAAATAVRPEVLAEHTSLCQRFVPNPHGTTRQSEAARRAVADAERRLLAALGVDWREAQVIWTSGGTEADNLACAGVLCRAAPDAACLVDAGAHAAMLEPCQRAATCGEIPLDKAGALQLDSLDWSSADLVAVCQVNNETGAVADLPRLRRAMADGGSQALLAVDAVQAVGKIPIPWREARLDLVALSARKIGGPRSVGALLVRRGVALQPLLVGGGQQRGVRAGTVDVVGALEFASAAELAIREQEEHATHCRLLAAQIREGVMSIPGLRICVVSPDHAVPHIVALSLPGYEAAVLMRLLAEEDVVVGAGSACHAESAETSHVLRAMGHDELTARGLLRISLGADSSAADVEALLVALRRVLRNY